MSDHRYLPLLSELPLSNLKGPWRTYWVPGIAPAQLVLDSALLASSF